MTTETINGLHNCKPGNEPELGATKTFVIEHHPAKNDKKAWIKIKSAGADYGGTPFRIISAEPTGFTDTHGNISFNLEIEPLGGGGENKQKPVQAASSPSQTFNPLDERQRAIIRQHSQSMALTLLELKSKLGELSVEDLTPAKLRALADYFDADVLGATQ